MTIYKVEKSIEVLETGKYTGVVINEIAPKDTDQFKYQRFLVDVKIDEEIKRISMDFPAKVTKKTGLGKFLGALLGVDLDKEGAEANCMSCVGKKFNFDAMKKTKDKDGKKMEYNELDNFKLIK